MRETDPFMQWYRMRDDGSSGAVPIEHGDAKRWNAKQWGIFWTINHFADHRRVIENLEAVCGWAVDMDHGTKCEQRARIKSAPLIPSMVNETASGFHVYYFAADGRAETWREIVEMRLLPYFGADPRAKDLARILRVPGFYHWKNPEHPVLVKTVDYRATYYREAQMLRAFPRVGEKPKEAPKRREFSPPSGDSIWDRIYALDCVDALGRLSGHTAVGGETYELKPIPGGKHAIWVNGKSTSCWVDADGKIGSLDGGGPSLACWLRWFGHSWADALKVILEIYPELDEKRRVS